MGKSTMLSGVILIMTIFISLCILTFSILTVISIEDETAIFEVITSSDEKYKLACNTADEILSKLVKINVDLENVNIEQLKDSILASYEVEIDENRVLEVEVEIKEGTYEILKWQQVYIGDWEPDEGIDIWDGN